MIYEKIRDLPDKPLVFYTNHSEICEHHHASIEIAYVIRGTVTICADAAVYSLSERQFAVIGSNIIHSYTAQKGLCIVVLLPLAMLTPFRSKLVGCTFSPCVFTDTVDGLIKTLFDTMAKVIGNTADFEDSNNKDALLQSLTYTFMVYLLGKTTFEKKTKRSIPDGAAITEYLQHNYMTDISASSLAKRFGYTEKHMTEIVKCLCGMPLKDYIRMLRINEGKRLLLENHTLDDIASRVGFSCTRTFLRSFVKITGQTPSAYKKYCTAGISASLPPNDELYFH